MARQTKTGPYVGVHFGEMIQEVWLESGMTQKEFAVLLGVRQPRVAEIFASESISERTLDRCLAALGAELEVWVSK